MSVDDVKSKNKAKTRPIDINWNKLIQEAEFQIKQARGKIKKLKGSIRFFEQQIGAGRGSIK